MREKILTSEALRATRVNDRTYLTMTGDNYASESG
jgi:hypothetical protein